MNASAFLSALFDNLLYFSVSENKLLISKAKEGELRDLTRIASGFGKRIDPFTKAKKFHYGIDFTAPQGTPVYASGDGVVTRADNRSSGYGNHIRIDHGYGYTSLYAHLYKFNVKRYQRVKRGDLIGYVGNTGRSSAPHLHYEIRIGGKAINPMKFIKAAQNVF